MSESAALEEFLPQDRLGLLIGSLCQIFAVISGVVLLSMATMSLVSILGRSLLDSPVLGDYEIVQMMSAVAVTMSLPYALWANGHVIVNFFTVNAHPSFNLFLDTVAGLLMALTGGIFTWRVALGLIDLRGSLDSSMLLGLPTWWGYVPMVPSFALLCVAALYITFSRLFKGF